MSIFALTTRLPEALFFKRNDPHDLRLGDIVSSNPNDYEAAEIVILGCPQDEGVRRNKGRLGAADAPNEIRKAFYKLTNFGIESKIFDLGNTVVLPTLEATHEAQAKIIRQLLEDKKRIISLGGGNDIAYPDCRALSEFAGAENVLALNIDAHFDVRADEAPNSGTPYRQLLEEKLILPEKFYEIGWQEQVNSPVYYEYLANLGVNLIGLGEFRTIDDFTISVLRLRSEPIFWGFDVDAVRASDAPGTSAPSPVGLMADEFCDLAAIAGFQANTHIIEFSEVNPHYDIDGRTARLVAVAMHRFCAASHRQP